MVTLSYHAFVILILLALFLGFQGGWWKSEREREKKAQKKWRDAQANLPRAYRDRSQNAKQ